MLLTLPPEVVERIVRLALPMPTDMFTFSKRMDTLRALCLVSTALRAVAQPIHQEVVLLSSDELWEGFKRTKALQYGFVHVVWVLPTDLPRSAYSSWSGIASKVRQCSALRDLRLIGIQDLNMSHFLPQVKSLDWIDVSLTRTDNFAITQAAFPSLLALACQHVEQCEPAVFERLECFFWVDDYFRGQQCNALADPRRILCDFDWERRWTGRLPEAEDIDSLTAQLEQSGQDLHFSVLVFPLQFCPDDHSDLGISMTTFVAACRSREVTVLFEDNGSYDPRPRWFRPSYEPFPPCPAVSPLFWRYAKELKAMEETADEAAQ
ncbi:hypothetical protein JCM8097_000948 [Rhodosporidiobolus ruineniae]